MKSKFLYLSIMLMSIFSCKQDEKSIQQWKSYEISFSSTAEYENPYTEVDLWVDFTHSGGTKITRPGYWDGQNVWKVRFASPYDTGKWNYTTYTNKPDDKGLMNQGGSLICEPYSGNNPLIMHGLLKMSPQHRNVIHADGTPFLMIGDTPWALPWRGTYETVAAYAKNRQQRGFNTALLMSLQPDRDAEGPENRTDTAAFAVAFTDLKNGHINDINIDYYQYLDSLVDILIHHEIVPVYQPVFHGFGWKGKNVLGWDVDAEEYARYCKYLIARYGASPAMWLVGADSDGRNTGITEGGETFEEWDAYGQPTGLHYSPFDDYVPDWWDRETVYEPHFNKTHQEAEWLDFQWAQTGHGGEHLTHKVERMYENKPVKAAANGEPTYEGIKQPDNGSGWWQGHEAWLQYTSGGTMGVVYGAGGLWNWKLFPNETGWPEWANSNASWKETIELPGSVYVGYLNKALEGLNTTDIEKHPELAEGNLCLAKPGELYIIYLPEGGDVTVNGLVPNMKFKWFDPLKGEFLGEGVVSSNSEGFITEKGNPAILIIK